MEQLVEGDRHRTGNGVEHDNISDESMDRDNDNGKTGHDMDRPALTNGSLHHLQEQVKITHDLQSVLY